jgi:SAM-dependent methyltransferase
MNKHIDPDWADSDEFWEGLSYFMFPPERMARATAEVDMIELLLTLTPGSRILDLCCGPGRHAIELARRGHDVVGVDRTARYLEMAGAQAHTAGLAVELVQADARDFRCVPPADAVLNLWTSFGYFDDQEDNQRVLCQAHASLRPGGVLLVQTRSSETFSTHVDSERTWQERDGVLYLEERLIVDDWRRTQGRWIIVDGDGRREYPYVSWLYSGAALADMMKKAGFCSVSLYGDLSGAPYDRKARNLVAVAVK